MAVCARDISPLFSGKFRERRLPRRDEGKGDIALVIMYIAIKVETTKLEVIKR